MSPLTIPLRKPIAVPFTKIIRTFVYRSCYNIRLIKEPYYDCKLFIFFHNYTPS